VKIRRRRESPRTADGEPLEPRAAHLHLAGSQGCGSSIVGNRTNNSDPTQSPSGNANWHPLFPHHARIYAPVRVECTSDEVGGFRAVGRLAGATLPHTSGGGARLASRARRSLESHRREGGAHRRLTDCSVGECRFGTGSTTLRREARSVCPWAPSEPHRTKALDTRAALPRSPPGYRSQPGSSPL
jgi:hypothetical protein